MRHTMKRRRQREKRKWGSAATQVPHCDACEKNKPKSEMVRAGLCRDCAIRIDRENYWRRLEQRRNSGYSGKVLEGRG